MKKITQLLIFLPAIAFAQNTDVLKQKANRVDFNTRTNAPAFVELKSNQNLRYQTFPNYCIKFSAKINIKTKWADLMYL